jgi:hypothetical protein
MLVEGLDTMVNQPEEKQFTENRKASATLLTCSGGGLLSLALSSVSLSLSGEGKERSGSVPKTSKGKVVPRRDSLLILLDPKNMQSNTKSCPALLLSPCTTSIFQVSTFRPWKKEAVSLFVSIFACTSTAAKLRRTLLTVHSSHAGRAEPLRLALHIANTPFEDRRITKEEFQQLKKDGKLPYGTVPILQVCPH